MSGSPRIVERVIHAGTTINQFFSPEGPEAHDQFAGSVSGDDFARTPFWKRVLDICCLLITIPVCCR